GRVSIALGSQFSIRVNGSSPDGAVGRLYLRMQRANGSEVVTDAPPSDASSSMTFGPYIADHGGVWNIWAHVRDEGAPDWNSVVPWDENKHGWGTMHSPDIEVVTPPVGVTDDAEVENRMLSASGWAIDRDDGAPISQVEIFIDDVSIGSATLGVPRPDVANNAINVLLYPGPASRFNASGWTFAKYLNLLPGGSHVVRFVARDASGRTTTIGQHTFEVSAETLDTDADRAPDELELAAGLDPNNPNDVSLANFEHFGYDKADQLITDPVRGYSPDEEGNIK
ncbi:MAG: hypothetical protein ACREIA_03135, partial [Opitutaceae bacterium]